MKVSNNYLFRLIAPLMLVIFGTLINFTTNVRGDDKPKGTFSTIDFPGALFTQAALGINNKREIVGRYNTADGKVHGFLLSNGIYTSIDFPGNTHPLAVTVSRGINDKSEIAGFTNNGPAKRFGFVLRNGSFTLFDVPGTFLEQVMDINNRGEIFGRFQDDCAGHYVLFNENGISFTKIEFPIAASIDIGVGGLNDRGAMVGYYTSADGVGHGFLMTINNSTIISTTIDFPGAIDTVASGINNRGDIVGGYTSPDGRRHGFLLSKGKFTTIDFPGAANTNGAIGINDEGDIVGGYGLAGVPHGFLLQNNKDDDNDD